MATYLVYLVHLQAYRGTCIGGMDPLRSSACGASSHLPPATFLPFLPRHAHARRCGRWLVPQLASSGVEHNASCPVTIRPPSRWTKKTEKPTLRAFVPRGGGWLAGYRKAPGGRVQTEKSKPSSMSRGGGEDATKGGIDRSMGRSAGSGRVSGLAGGGGRKFSWLLYYGMSTRPFFGHLVSAPGKGTFQSMWPGT